jgi:hypothetical protein
MSQFKSPAQVVTVGGTTLNLTEPAQADQFLRIMRSYGEAATVEWGAEFDLAERTVSMDTYDRSGRH